MMSFLRLMAEDAARGLQCDANPGNRARILASRKAVHTVREPNILDGRVLPGDWLGTGHAGGVGDP